MTVQEAEKLSFNPFDVTKVWSHKEFPLIPVGKLVLDRNPKNYFAEVEQIAFAPSHLIPGVEASPDKMLQGRLFSYADTQRHRLGANYLQIPVNCPYKTRNYQRDGKIKINFIRFKRYLTVCVKKKVHKHSQITKLMLQIIFQIHSADQFTMKLI